MKTLIGLLLMMSGLSVYAGEKGNGGDAVVCRDRSGKITSAELLDYYEGRTLREFSVRDTSKLSDEQFIESTLTRLVELDEELFMSRLDSMDFLTTIREFQKKGGSRIAGVIFTKDPLVDIPDSHEMILKKGCKVEQLAIRLNQEFEEDPAYIIQSDILKALKDRDVRGLVLHEMIYRSLVYKASFFNYTTDNSIRARYLHQKLMSFAESSEFSFGDYVSVLKYVCDKTCNDGNFALNTGSTDYFTPKESYTYQNGFVQMKSLSSSMDVVFDRDGKRNLAETLKTGRLTISTVPAISGTGIIGRILVNTHQTGNMISMSINDPREKRNIAYGTYYTTAELLPAQEGQPESENTFGLQFNDRQVVHQILFKLKPGESKTKIITLHLNDDLRPYYTEEN